MTKQEARKAAELDLHPLEDMLLAWALQRAAHVLRPYPETAKQEEIALAVASLRARNLVHGPGREPNLTIAGIEAARALSGPGR